MTRSRSLSVVYFTPLYYVRVRPQNSELGPVPSCDRSSVISCPRQAGLHFFLNFNHALSLHHSLGILGIILVCLIHQPLLSRHWLSPSHWILHLISREKRLP